MPDSASEERRLREALEHAEATGQWSRALDAIRTMIVEPTERQRDEAEREVKEARAEIDRLTEEGIRGFQMRDKLFADADRARSDARKALAAAKWELEGRSFKRALEIIDAALAQGPLTELPNEIFDRGDE